MVSEEEIERRKRIERHIQNKIDYLKTTTDGYKGAIDKCDAAELSSYSWIIATQTKGLKDASSHLNKGQEEQFDNLQKFFLACFLIIFIKEVYKSTNMNETRTALVTGGAGFIGSHIVDRLISNNYKVIVLDNLSGGFEENINPKSKFIKGSITDEQLVKNIFDEKHCDFCFWRRNQRTKYN